MFNIANLFTASNLLAGFLSILFAVTGHIDLAVWAIFAGAFFDFLDGFAARIFKTSGDLGKQLDSLADMVTFGVAPGMLMMVVLTINLSVDYSSTEVQTGFLEWVDSLLNLNPTAFYPLAGLIIPFFSLFRLAKFNIDTRQTTSFIGLPTPVNTLFFTAFPLAIVFTNEAMSSYIQVVFHPILITLTIFIMGLLMVSEIPFFSLKFNKTGIKGNEIRYLFLLISMIIIVLFSVWAIALIVFLYLILSIIENTFLTSKKNEI